MAFIDFYKAFDSIDLRAIHEARNNQAVKKQYLDTLTNIYRADNARIKIYDDNQGNTVNYTP